MNRLRRIIFWCHLAVGVTAGVVIFIMATTGVLLAFERPAVRFAERNITSVNKPEQGTARLSPRTLLSKAEQARPEIKPTGLTLHSDPTAAATVTLGRDGVLYLNPYSGEVLGLGVGRTRAFFRFVEDLHRRLGMAGNNRALGRTLTGACNAGFLALAISGVYLWWPRSWSSRKVRSVIFFQRGLKGRARNFNWHNTVGFWSSAILIVVTASGLVLSYQWANNLLYRLMGSEPAVQQRPGNRSVAASTNPPSQAASKQVVTGAKATRSARDGLRSSRDLLAIPENLDQLWLRAEQQTSWQSITLRLPVMQDAPVVFSIREGKAWLEAANSQLTLNSTSAEVTKWEPYAASSAGRKARTWVRFLHTGEAGGILGQIVAALASLGGGVLVFTGLSLAWRRFRNWVKQRQAYHRALADGVSNLW